MSDNAPAWLLLCGRGIIVNQRSIFSKENASDW